MSNSRIFLVITLCGVCTCAIAAPPLPSFAPSAALVDQMELSGMWAEVYPVKAAEVQKAIDLAVKKHLPPAANAVGVVTAGAMHATVRGQAVSFAEATSGTTRRGVPVQYDAACTVIPQKGDRLVATYVNEATGETLTLDTKLVVHYAFAPGSSAVLNGEPQPVPVRCHGTSSRTFFAGTLALTKNGSVKAQSAVLVQSLFEPVP